MKKHILLAWMYSAATLAGISQAATPSKPTNAPADPGRMVMFVGMDISGSFMNTWKFDDSVRFAAHYIEAHLKGMSEFEVPNQLFVGSIGGAKPNEPKTFFPKQTFEYRNASDIEKKLREIFPKKVQNKFTDYNAFFEQIAAFVRNKKLVLKPITIVMFSDGVPDAPLKGGKQDYCNIKLRPLENLAPNITLRVLYTSAVVGLDWQSKIARERVKVWTQDAEVMKLWKESNIMQPGLAFEKQDRFFSWVKDNVNFPVGKKVVDGKCSK